MSRALIINADDFGLSVGVNRGIIDAFRSDGITSTSMMVNMPGFEDAVNWARKVPTLGIGLHFNLTYGRPLSNRYEVSTLIQPDGNFAHIRLFGSGTEQAVLIELEAQYNKLLAAGIQPTHLDSHHLLHQQFPFVFKVMSHFAAANNLPLRHSQINHPTIQSAAARTDSLILDSYGGKIGLHKLIGYLQSLPSGVTELTCHPGYADEVVRQYSEWIEVREEELAVFCHPVVAETIALFRIQAISYSKLAEYRKSVVQG